MEFLLEFFGRTAVYVILFMVAILIAQLVRRYLNKRDLASLPEPVERRRLLGEIKRKRQNGESHQSCIQYLQKEGLRKGVAEGLLIDVEREQVPDLQETRTLRWNQWTCEYPGNWKEQLLDHEIPRDQGVCLEGLGGSGIYFYNHPEINADQLLEEQKQHLVKASCTSFSNWGPLPGQGQRLIGVQDTYKLTLEIRIFQPHDPASLAIMEVTMAEEQPGAGLAFDLIESSFQLLKNHPQHD